MLVDWVINFDWVTGAGFNYTSINETIYKTITIKLWTMYEKFPLD